MSTSGRRLAGVAGMVVLVALALSAAACGGAPSTAGSNGTSKNASSTGRPATSAELAFAHCMRSNGVRSFPDPSSSGGFPKSTLARLAAHDSDFEAATRTCAHLLPGGRSGANAAELQHVRAEGVQFARCMRRHGVDLPDPASTGRIPDPATVGVDQGSPQFETANQSCARYRPPYMPSNSQYNAYAKTRGS